MGDVVPVVPSGSSSIHSWSVVYFFSWTVCGTERLGIVHVTSNCRLDDAHRSRGQKICVCWMLELLVCWGRSVVERRARRAVLVCYGIWASVLARALRSLGSVFLLP